MVQILSGAMLFLTFPSGPFETNAYIYFAPNGEGYLIDAPPESFIPISKALKENNIALTHLLLTHTHWDHIGDASLFKKAFPNLQIGVHELDQENLKVPGSDGLPSWLNIEGIEPDFIFKEGDHIGPFKVIDTPGHTPGGVCFYDEAEGNLFSGDTLFKGSIGNLSFPTARPELMWKSLDKLAKLPPNVVVFPGHGQITTIGQETWLPNARNYFG